MTSWISYIIMKHGYFSSKFPFNSQLGRRALLLWWTFLSIFLGVHGICYVYFESYPLSLLPTHTLEVCSTHIIFPAHALTIIIKDCYFSSIQPNDSAFLWTKEWRQPHGQEEWFIFFTNIISVDRDRKTLSVDGSESAKYGHSKIFLGNRIIICFICKRINGLLCMH